MTTTPVTPEEHDLVDEARRAPTAPGRNASDHLEMLEISKRPNPWQRLVNVWRYRELFSNLVRKELKVKYKNSFLGFLWSLLNPAFLIAVYSFVFIALFHQGLKNFALFMMAGILVWNFFSVAVASGTSVIVANDSLVKKVWFPREVLPLASVGAAFVHFLLQSIVMLAALLIFVQIPSGTYAVLLIPALFDMIVFTAAMGVFLSSVNVYLRDMTHLVEILLMAWFWATPIVYPVMTFTRWTSHLAAVLIINPVAGVVVTFQRVLYNDAIGSGQYFDPATKQHPVAVPDWSIGHYAAILGIIAVISVVLLWIALMVFGRLEDNFAEEL